MSEIIADLSVEAFERAAIHLCSMDEAWAQHIENTGPCVHQAKPRREPYEALVRAVAYQQLHAKAGNAILGRLMALYPENVFPTPQQLLDKEPEVQRGCGFSAAKLNTIRGIAQATIDGVVPSLTEALRMSDSELVTRLTSLRGIGKWTVEMFLIYSLKRSDILPVDDYGIREGYRRLQGLSVAPTAREMHDIGLQWAPHRTVAAWYLWRCT